MTSWMPLLSGADADDALRIAREVARRLRDPERLAGANWGPAGVAQSHPGLAIGFAQLDACFPGEGWAEAAHEEVARSVAALRGATVVPTGLFAGLAGTAFAAHFVDRGRYAKLLGTLDGLIARRLEGLLARLDGRERGYAEHEIDVVSGLAGIGAYALDRGNEALLQPVVDRLLGLIEADDDVPAWHTPPELLDDDARRNSPTGRINCGLAHGIPGPIALLGLARETGLRRAADWLVDTSFEDEWGINWPYSVPLDRPARAAWCYGAPGIARSLWLAGEALSDVELQQLAVEAVEAVFRRPREQLALDGVTFCHGLAGMLQITMRMAADSDSEPLRASAAGLAGEIIERFEPDSRFGYRGLDPDNRAEDKPGLLEGASGVVVVLLATATSQPPRWDRVFLLA